MLMRGLLGVALVCSLLVDGRAAQQSTTTSARTYPFTLAVAPGSAIRETQSGSFVFPTVTYTRKGGSDAKAAFVKLSIGDMALTPTDSVTLSQAGSLAPAVWRPDQNAFKLILEVAKTGGLSGRSVTDDLLQIALFDARTEKKEREQAVTDDSGQLSDWLRIPIKRR